MVNIKIKKLLLWTLMMMFALTSCGDVDDVDEVTLADELVFMIPAESNNMDPNFTNETFSTIVLNHMYEGLLTINETGDLVPGAAMSYEVSDQNTTFTFKLRTDLKWSDGQPVTADDYRNSWLRIIEPAANAESASLIAPYIVNVDEYMAGEVKQEDVGIMVIDEHTLVIKTKIPTPFLPDIISHSIFYPVRFDVIEKGGEHWGKNPEVAISNGPFVLSDYEENGYYELTKNPFYWDADSIKLNKIKFTFNKKENDMITLYNNGEIDGIYQVSENELHSMMNNDLVINSQMLPSTVFITVNHNNPLMQNKTLREALSISIDREGIVNEVLLGAGIPTQYLVPIVYQISGQPYRDYLELNDGVDYEKANSLINELKDEGIYNGRAIKLYYNENYEIEKVIDFIVRSFKENLNMEIEAMGMSWSELYDVARYDEYDLIFMGWTADYPHPMTFLSAFQQGAFYSRITRWEDQEYEESIDMFLNSTNESDALETLLSIEDMILDEHHIFPIYYRKSTSVMRSNIKGWYKSSSNIYLQNAWIEE